MLSRLGLPFATVNPSLDETPLPAESPYETALRLSEAKARAAMESYPEALIIGSDQIACLGNQSFGKPGTHENAIRQLQTLRGQTVDFYTGLCLYNSRTGCTHLKGISTLVTFRHLTDREIENYLIREKPYNCAGSAKSEGLGIAILEKMVSEDPTAIIGLPLIALCEFLRAEGVHII